jgi:hypothetical protein
MSYDFIVKQPHGSPERDPEEIRCALVTIPELVGTEIAAHDPLDADDAMDYLLDSFEDDGDDAKQEYRTFCKSNGFPDNVDSPNRAAALEYAIRELGISLATVYIPRGTPRADAQRAVHALARFAKANQLIIEDPQLGAEVDLDNPDC